METLNKYCVMRIGKITQGILAVVAAGAVGLPCHAQVPSTIHYQGRVEVNGQPFTGQGQFKFALVDGAGARLWSQDGTGGGNAEPAGAVTLPVQDGLFAVGLGDTAVPGMTQPIPTSVFADHGEVFVRLWFNDGLNGFARLEPDQRVTSTGYAMVADTARQSVPGAITESMLAGNAVTGAKIRDASVTAADLNTGSFETTFWRAQGNAGTTAGAHFLGTRDNAPLEFRVNNQRVLRLEPRGNPNVIGGHAANTVSAGFGGATIGGGGGSGDSAQRILQPFGTVGGGHGNTAGGNSSTVAGGQHNTAGGTWAAIGGGADNSVNGFLSTVAGGWTNRVAGDYSVIAGGVQNRALSGRGAIVGGENNEVRGNWSLVGGGRDNTGFGDYGVLAGGQDNFIHGDASHGMIPGGQDNRVEGSHAFAAGRQAKAVHAGAFVWGDAAAADFSSVRDNEFAIRADGGLRLQSQRGIALNAGDRPMITRGWDAFSADAPEYKQGHGRWGLFMEFTALVVGMPTLANRYLRFARYDPDGTYVTLAEIQQDGTFRTTGPVNPPSDRRVKQDFEDVDARDILERVVAMPVQSWSYTNAPTVRHIGPVAQDFQAAFAMGADDTAISTVDADGVALAAIQGLNAKVEEQRAALEKKDARIRALEEAVAGLRELMAR